MSKLKKEFSDETKQRLLKLENELEEFKVCVTEDNLKLKIPYVCDKGMNNLSFKYVSETNVLEVYSRENKIGQIALS